MKQLVLKSKQDLLNEAFIKIENDYKGGAISDREKKALLIQVALMENEKQIETKAAIRYSLIYDGFTQAWFSELGYNSMDVWLDSFGMNPRGNGNLGQVYRIATILTPFCEEQFLEVNGNPVNHDWFIDSVINKCRVNRARHIISRACNIINMTSRVMGDRASEIVQLLEWVDDPNITNDELREQVKEDEGKDGEGGDGPRIPMTVSYNADGVFTLEAQLEEDEYQFFKRKAGHFVDINEV
jgi:hypothetical protein